MNSTEQIDNCLIEFITAFHIFSGESADRELRCNIIPILADIISRQSFILEDDEVAVNMDTNQRVLDKMAHLHLLMAQKCTCN